MVSSLIALVACAPASTSSTTISTPKEITLEDASDILNISLLLPSRFDQIDAASEGLSNEDLGLGSDYSEVYLFLAEDPFQVIYSALAISKSRIEQASWDSILEDEYQLKSIIIQNLKAGADTVTPRLVIQTADLEVKAFCLNVVSARGFGIAPGSHTAAYSSDNYGADDHHA